MSEAETTQPSQRSRAISPSKNKKSGDVSSPIKAALVAGLCILFSSTITPIRQAHSDESVQSAIFAETTRFTVSTRTIIDLPPVLANEDLERYQAIFAAQAEDLWPEANRLIATLENKLLLGHVQAQRYLHPRYRSSYRELASWLATYGDHPDARRIHALALKRKPANLDAPADPYGGGKLPPGGIKTAAIAPPPERWGPALENFRNKRYTAAARQFEAVARLPKASPWVVSAGAFWAARAHMLSGQPQRVTEWLHKAAQHPLTFYGLLARETLGIAGDLDLRDPLLHLDDAQALIAQQAGARAIALLQISEPKRAEAELANVNIGESAPLARAVVALANHLNMPSLSLRMGNRTIGLEQAEQDAAIYPIPAWQPLGGFDIDRALIYALMRRESSFNPDARNQSGASGLMQLMPATARAMAGRPLSSGKLLEPETNISLSQKYLHRLLTDGAVNGDLIRLAAAYNAGPGNVAKWQRQTTEDDPLLFIASLPSRETRIFIESVLADLWIYHMRLGQQNPSLTTLASGGWPMYVAQDGLARSLAEATPTSKSATITDAGH